MTFAAGILVGALVASAVWAIASRIFLRKMNAVLRELDTELTRQGYPEPWMPPEDKR
jgi:hypothetical protein